MWHSSPSIYSNLSSFKHCPISCKCNRPHSSNSRNHSNSKRCHCLQIQQLRQSLDRICHPCKSHRSTIHDQMCKTKPQHQMLAPARCSHAKVFRMHKNRRCHRCSRRWSRPHWISQVVHQNPHYHHKCHRPWPVQLARQRVMRIFLRPLYPIHRQAWTLRPAWR